MASQSRSPEPKQPGSASSSVGESMAVSAEHLRGLHVSANPLCWRCQRELEGRAPNLHGESGSR